MVAIIVVVVVNCRAWNKMQHQFSNSTYLERDVPYYLELFTMQRGGPWEIGLGAKLHNSSLHGGDYDADREQQKIEVTSDWHLEQHVSPISLNVVFFNIINPITVHYKIQLLPESVTYQLIYQVNGFRKIIR